MKISKKDLVLIDFLIAEKLSELKLCVLNLKVSERFMSAYDFLGENEKLELEINKYTKLREKVSKLMEGEKMI